MIPEKAIKPIVKNGRDNTEIAVGTLLAYGVFPQTNEGIQKAKDTIAANDNWLVPSLLPNYYDGIDSDLLVGRETPGIINIRGLLKQFYKISADTEDFVDTQVYTPGDKFVDDGKEFVLEIESAQRDALEETSDKIMDAIDEILRKDQEKFEEFKAKQAEELKKRIEKINKPERIAEELTIKIPPAHYIQGQAGRWQPEFENDIDHAVYFAGKSPLPKGAKQREVLDWLKSLGLTFEQIHDHREKVLDQIRETISLPGVDEEYPYVYIDAVDQDFVLEDDEDEYEDIEEDLDGLDDLLNDVRNDEEISDKKISENIEEEIVDAAEDDEEDPMADADVDIQAILDGDEDETKSIAEKLTDTINKPKKESSYASNKKILDSIIVNFGRIQSTLDVVNKNLEQQNTLIRANIDTQLAVGDLISNQTDLLASKFDLILEHFEKQLQHSEELDEAEKRKASESNLEAQRDAAGVSDFKDLTKKPSGKKRENKIEKYLKGKLTRKLYRKLPKSVRNARQKVRKLQRMPGRAQAKAASKITSMLPTRGQQAVGAMSKIRGAGSVGRVAGPARYAFAGLEYGERKAAGQSELQAQAGVGSGLAGASLGAGLVSAGVALLPTAPTGWGAVAAGSLILLGSILGGTVASGAADKITGADKVTGEHETGGLTKPGTAMLHGTEAIINRDAFDMSPLNTLGGIMIASTTEYINSAGAVAAPIAPSLRGVSAQMARQYDVPATLAQTNVGGSLPNLSGQLKKVKEKRKQTPEEELSGIEKDLIETQDPQSFADKLLKMLDPEGKFQELLKQINHTNPVGETGEGMAVFGESGIDKGTGFNGAGWVHGHFQNSNKQSLVSDTLEVVKKLINSGVSTVITATNKDLTKDMSEDELRRHIEAGVDGHKKYGSGVHAIDVSVPAGTKVPYELENVFDSKGPGGIVGTMKGRTTQIMHLAPGSKAGAAPGTTQVSPGAAPTGDFDVIIPLDHVKPGNENKIPDKKGGNTFENARATGAAGRERDHQDKAAAKVKAKLEAKGLRVKVITPEDFGNYEDYDKYITAQASKNVRIVPLHFDAAVGQGGTGFLTRTKKGDSGDAALAKPIQQKLSSFQKANPELGNLGPTDTVSNATINRASASPAALVEMGSMVAWEKQHGSNFTSTNKFDELATGIAEGVYQGGGFNNNIKPPSQQPRFQSLQGKDGNDDTKYLIVNQQAKPQITGQGSQSASSFVSMGDGRWRSENEISTTIRNLYIQRLGQ